MGTDDGPDLDLLFGEESAGPISGASIKGSLGADDGPDLDHLFGQETIACGPNFSGGAEVDEFFDANSASPVATPQGAAAEPHPALRHAVVKLVEEAWPSVASELRSGARPATHVEAKPAAPALRAELADKLEEALAAMRRCAWAECRSAAEPARASAWDVLFAGKGWQQDCDRELFIFAELLTALCASSDDALTAVRRADSVFVFAPAGPFRDAALLFVRLLDDRARSQRMEVEAHATSPSGSATLTFGATLPRWAPPSPDGVVAVPRVHAPCLEVLRRLIAEDRPFVVHGGELEAWPAHERWASLAYLDRVVGHRLVPIEVGGTVGGAGWREELMLLSDFLRTQLAPSCEHCAKEEGREESRAGFGAVAYLAQHELLDQCPVLRADVDVPASWREVLGWPARVNAWLGTHGTVTPCHWDSYANFLTQVQGRKRALLLAPEAKSRLYVDEASGGIAAQGNISPVDVEAPDLSKFPAFEGSRVELAEIGPGDALFMPRGWWHQVRALTPSFSVNFWF